MLLFYHSVEFCELPNYDFQLMVFGPTWIKGQIGLSQALTILIANETFSL